MEHSRPRIEPRSLNVLWSQLQGDPLGFRYGVACWGALVEGYSVKEFRGNQRCLVEGGRSCRACVGGVERQERRLTRL